MKAVTIVTTVLAPQLLAGHAHAHIGHAGELAGHSHWIGVAAAGAAVAIAVAVATLGKKNEDAMDEDELDVANGDRADTDAEVKA
jgi:hypothetical protein